MKVVLDTNVLVSAALTTHGKCGQILDLLVEGGFEICADDRILDEYDTVLRRPEFRIVTEEADVLLELIRSLAGLVASVPLNATLPDPDDMPFLEVAAASDAILVTGNLRHFPKKGCQGVTVVSPTEFLEILRHLS